MHVRFTNFCHHFLQKFIFEKASPNIRKIVLATNMAEASITINDIVFVVDCGKAKETTYDALNNTPCLLPSWISQASARQVSSFVHWLLQFSVTGVILNFSAPSSEGYGCESSSNF